MGQSGKATGIWADELVIPYYALLDVGIAVELASPRGGAVPFDPASLKAQGQNPPLVERFLADPAAQAAVRSTSVAADLNAASFDAVFFPGGHGTMWDLPEDAGVTRAVETAFAQGKIVAAVCHGPAGLVTAKGPDGRSILAGKRVNCFTDAEEEAAGLAAVVPFRLESRLRELGGHFEAAPSWQPFAVRDGNLITGQNPMSSGLVANLVLEALAASA
ncbi:MAG TPA: type 1 glutamine amidotransferase domain-containing protein, partial [Rhodocyclaceae bacterium]|nr:type 1 glutamine amidotransferase domain-containing protein [Rhodocyclaceae bacterium]